MFWSRCNLYRIGIAYLCMKTVERAHKPATLWHRIALDRNYSKALKQVDSLLAHWYTLLRDNVFIFLLMVLLYRSRFLLHKSKQRLTKITQYLLRARILMREKRYWLDKCLSGSFFLIWFFVQLCRPRLVTLPAREQQRESRREFKVRGSVLIYLTALFLILVSTRHKSLHN